LQALATLLAELSIHLEMVSLEQAEVLEVAYRTLPEDGQIVSEGR
jgi:hypothetical protein